MGSLVDPSYELVDPTPDVHALFCDFDRRFFDGSLGACEVKWSPRMTTCAGICCYEVRSGLCSIKLSTPLLKLRPRKDLVETLLHEMIHAFLFVTVNDRDRDGHGPQFQWHMHRINKEAGTRITIYHSFHAEVAVYKQHHWRCDGPCRERRPFFGWVKRASNRAPSKNDLWWAEHERSCGGKYHKVSEPKEYTEKREKAERKKAEGAEKKKGGASTKGGGASSKVGGASAKAHDEDAQKKQPRIDAVFGGGGAKLGTAADGGGALKAVAVASSVGGGGGQMLGGGAGRSRLLDLFGSRSSSRGRGGSTVGGAAAARSTVGGGGNRSTTNDVEIIVLGMKPFRRVRRPAGNPNLEEDDGGSTDSHASVLDDGPQGWEDGADEYFDQHKFPSDDNDNDNQNMQDDEALHHIFNIPDHSPPQLSPEDSPLDTPNGPTIRMLERSLDSMNEKIRRMMEADDGSVPMHLINECTSMNETLKILREEDAAWRASWSRSGTSGTSAFAAGGVDATAKKGKEGKEWGMDYEEIENEEDEWGDQDMDKYRRLKKRREEEEACRASRPGTSGISGDRSPRGGTTRTVRRGFSRAGPRCLGRRGGAMQTGRLLEEERQREESLPVTSSLRWRDGDAISFQAMWERKRAGCGGDSLHLLRAAAKGKEGQEGEMDYEDEDEEEMEKGEDEWGEQDMEEYLQRARRQMSPLSYTGGSVSMTGDEAEMEDGEEMEEGEIEDEEEEEEEEEGEIEEYWEQVPVFRRLTQSQTYDNMSFSQWIVMPELPRHATPPVFVQLGTVEMIQWRRVEQPAEQPPAASPTAAVLGAAAAAPTEQPVAEEEEEMEDLSLLSLEEKKEEMEEEVEDEEEEEEEEGEDGEKTKRRKGAAPGRLVLPLSSFTFAKDTRTCHADAAKKKEFTGNDDQVVSQDNKENEVKEEQEVTREDDQMAAGDNKENESKKEAVTGNEDPVALEDKEENEVKKEEVSGNDDQVSTENKDEVNEEEGEAMEEEEVTGNDDQMASGDKKENDGKKATRKRPACHVVEGEADLQAGSIIDPSDTVDEPQAKIARE